MPTATNLGRSPAGRAATPDGAEPVVSGKAGIPNAFTPGPWVNAGDDEQEGFPYLVIETDQPIGSQLRPICHVQPSYHQASDTFAVLPEDEANAHLIAAAPELYEALTLATRSLEIVNETLAETGGGTSDSAATVAQIGRAALAKARGEA